MARFPSDAPKRRILKALRALGFQVVREREHVALVRENAVLDELDRLMGIEPPRPPA